MTVLHRPRVAWEAARVFVAATDDDAYWWLSEMVGRYLGLMFQFKLSETRLRLGREGAFAEFAEMGAWRARIEELLQDRPDLLPLVFELVTETSTRLCSAARDA
jgi:hypothetical protein